ATSMAEGNYHLRVPAGETGPEVTTLARAFNTMATRLEHTEQVRRQMLSVLAHEMSTPLSVLVVYLDGLQDGVVEWNITTHAILAEQLGRLTRLIEDIDEVSRAQEHRIDIDLVTEPLGELIHTAATTAQESYQVKGVGLQATDVSPAATVTVDRQRFGPLMRTALANALHHAELIHTAPTTAQQSYQVKGVALQATDVSPAATVTVDRQRFGQVMSNLLANALRHTPAGGHVTISATQQGAGTILIEVADTG